MCPCGQSLSLQLACRCRQVQILPGFTGQAPTFFEDACTYAPTASELTYAQVRQTPVGRASLQQGGTEQPVIETTRDQAVVGQPGLDQGCGICVRRQEPGRGVGEDFRQIDTVLLAGLGYGFNENGHVDLAVVVSDGKDNRAGSATHDPTVR